MLRLVDGSYRAIPVRFLGIFKTGWQCGRCGAKFDKLTDLSFENEEHSHFRCPCCKLFFAKICWYSVPVSKVNTQEEFVILAGQKELFPKGEDWICLLENCHGIIYGSGENGWCCSKCKTKYGMNLAGTLSAKAVLDVIDPRGYIIID